MRRDPSGWLLRFSERAEAEFVGNGAWRNRTTYDDFAPLAASEPNRILIQQSDTILTRGKLMRQAQQLAAAFKRLQISPGDVISVMLPNWPEAAVIDLAATMSGVVLNLIVPIYRAAETRFILKDSRSRLLFIPDQFRGFDYLEMMRSIRAELPDLRHVVVVRGSRSSSDDTDFTALLQDMPIDARELPRVDANAVKLVLYTSGTTGAPKGVLHSHNTIAAEIRTVTRHWSLTMNDSVFMPSPLTHITGYLYGIQLPLTTGMDAIYMEQWNPHEAFELLQKHRSTFTVAATPFLQQLTDIAQSRGSTLPALRYFLCGGAPVPPDLIYASRRAFVNCIPCRVYGSTEAPTITLGPVERDSDLAATTDGLIVGHQVKLVGSAGEDVPPGAEGEVLTRGPELFLGYTDPAHNRDAFDAEGYFRMGDLARQCEPGWLTITGRVKDLIIRGGENISAKEVEDVLHQHPAVQEVAVVGMPHSRLGETCCAFIVPKQGCSITLEEVVAWVAEAGLAKQKTPERVEIVADFPRTASGKIRKVELREQVAKKLATSGAD